MLWNKWISFFISKSFEMIRETHYWNLTKKGLPPKLKQLQKIMKTKYWLDKFVGFADYLHKNYSKNTYTYVSHVWSSEWKDHLNNKST